MPKYRGSSPRRTARRHVVIISTLVGAALVAGTTLASTALQADPPETKAVAADRLTEIPPLGTPTAEPELDETAVAKQGWQTAARPRPTPKRTPSPTPTPSEQPTQKPTPSPAPTKEPSQDPTTSAPPESEPPSFSGDVPDETTTGVPAGTKLTASGSITVTENGTVIDALHVKGIVRVQANDVTIKRSLIDNTGTYPIEIASGYRNLLVEDTEIDGNGKANVAILRGEYTLRRVNIHSVLDGPRIEGDNVVIEDSYIHDLYRVSGGHHDSIQVRKGKNLTIRGNNLQAYNAKTGDPMNAAIQFGSLLDTVDSVLVEGNLMNGGNFTVNAVKLDGGSVVFRDNQFGRDYRYGIVSPGPGLEWASSNIYADDGSPAR